MSDKRHKKPTQKPSANNKSSADTIADLLAEADGGLFAEPSPSSNSDDSDDATTVDKQETHLPEEHIQTYQQQQAKIASLEEEVRKSHDLFVRARAEADNIKRRSDKAIADAHKYGLEKFAKQLLEVLDSLERALEVEVPSDQPAVASLHEGVQLTLDMLLSTFSKFDIQVVNPVSEAFDPQLHEAMVMQPDSGAASGTILNVIQKGYVLQGRLIRPARVIVAK